MELKVIFLEIVYLDLYSDKVWGFSIFSFCTPLGDIYGRPLLKWLQKALFMPLVVVFRSFSQNFPPVLPNVENELKILELINHIQTGRGKS